MPNWSALAVADPGGTPQDAAAALSDSAHATLASKENVELRPGVVVAALADTGELVALQAAAANPAHPQYAVAAPAVGAIRAASEYGLTVKLWAGAPHRALWDSLLSAGLISADTHAVVVAMASRGRSWAELHWPAPVITADDVSRARLIAQG